MKIINCHYKGMKVVCTGPTLCNRDCQLHFIVEASNLDKLTKTQQIVALSKLSKPQRIVQRLDHPNHHELAIFNEFKNSSQQSVAG